MSIPFERHYRVQELAELWAMSVKTITRLFETEPGVVRLTNEGKGKRAYATISIPESVAIRVHERLSQPKAPEQILHLRDKRQPPRIIKFRELRKSQKIHDAGKQAGEKQKTTKPVTSNSGTGD
jgi:hypothetical protein